MVERMDIILTPMFRSPTASPFDNQIGLKLTIPEDIMCGYKKR